MSSSCLRWVTMALVGTLPWTKRHWALPDFVCAEHHPQSVSEGLKRRHKALAPLAQQMVKVVRRWLADVAIKVIGPAAYWLSS